MTERSIPLQLHRDTDLSEDFCNEWMNMIEVKETFAPLRLGVFHALWGFQHGADCNSREPGAPTKAETRKAYTRVPKSGGHSQTCEELTGDVYRLSDLYW